MILAIKGVEDYPGNGENEISENLKPRTNTVLSPSRKKDLVPAIGTRKDGITTSTKAVLVVNLNGTPNRTFGRTVKASFTMTVKREVNKGRGVV